MTPFGIKFTMLPIGVNHFVKSIGVMKVQAALPGAVLQTTAGPAVNYELATGPLRVAGIPRLRGTVTSAVDGRAFFALAVGTDPATAQVIQNNLLPYRSLLPAVQQPLNIELPGVAIDVPAGQHLYLTVSPFVSQYGGHVSRTPGAVLIENAVVDAPIT